MIAHVGFRSRMIAALAIGIVAWVASASSAQDRTPGRYHILARESANLKDYFLQRDGATCNIGVNNQGGVISTHKRFTMTVGELVADDCSGATGDVVACFCNSTDGFDETCAPWTAPILADESDATFVAACNDGMAGMDYPATFVSGTQDVTCGKGATDCDPLSADATPGNGVCDLIPGDYGKVNPKRGCSLHLGGVYNVADYKADKGVNLVIPDPTTMNVVGATTGLIFGDGNRMENQCGFLRVNLDGPVANFGRGARGLFLMDLCAPHALLRMRNSNTLQGHFFANQVRSDFNNTGLCCARGQCGCFDVVMPRTLPAGGGTLTLSGGCDLENITAVTVCDLPCPITYRDPARIECTAPPGSGSCMIKGESDAGVFVSKYDVQYP